MLDNELNTPSFGAEVNNLSAHADPATKAFFKKLQVRELEFELDKNEDEHSARKWLIDATFTVTVLWLVSVLLVFIALGKESLHYSDTVIVTFLSTTTANTFAFLTIIFQYLFRKPKQKSKRTSVKAV